MRKLLIAKPDRAVQRRLRFFAQSEAVALQPLLDPAIDALAQAVGSGRFWRGRAVLDVELLRVRRGALAQVEEQSVNFFLLPVKTVQMHSGQARSRSRRKRRALAAVPALKMRMKTRGVARSMATKR